MSEQTIRQAAIEWLVLKSILKHGCGASIFQITDDLERFCPEKEQVFECLAKLMVTGIISFSIERFDFLLSPYASTSPLAKALKESKPPQITIEEYMNYGWRKLARLS